MAENISTELRWALLAAGVLLLLALALFGRKRKQAMSEQVSTRNRANRAAESKRAATSSAPRHDSSQPPNVRRHFVAEPRVHDLGGIEVIEHASESEMGMVTNSFGELAPVNGSVQIESPMDDLPSIRAFDDDLEDVPVVEAVIESAALSRNVADSEPAPTGSRHATSRVASHAIGKVDSSVTPSEAKTIDLNTEQSKMAQSPRRPSSRKVVALRLSLTDLQIDGARLLECFQAEQLVFGKYNIFHRLDEVGIEVFSIANMAEPGIFDLTKMDSLQYGGLTFFMQVPGPHEATSAYDQMLDCARNLEEALQGALQDERGTPLSPLRAEHIREEIIDFQHLMGVTPSSSDERDNPPVR